MPKIVYGYKLFRNTKNGLRSLFIDRTRPLQTGIWLRYKPVKTKGYAYRPGWHILVRPHAPHLSKKNRVWYKVIARNIIAKHERPEAQGGVWYTAKEIYITGDSK